MPRLVVKRYEVEGPPAVDDLSFEVAEGEIYGLLGANGSGKSTTVGMLATLRLPTAGAATVAGFDVVTQADEVRRRIGVTLQEAGVDPGSTPRALLRLHAVLLGLRSREAARRAEELLESFDLGELANRGVRDLSGGNRRRLDLALALVGRPGVIFLDEPTNGLDPRSRRRMWDEVERLREEGAAVLLTTQYLEEADRLADRVGILDHGRLRAEGTPEELKRRVGGDVVLIEVAPADAAGAAAALSARDEGDGRLSLTVDDGGAAVPRVLAALDDRGVEVRSVALQRPTLDDVFLQVADERLEAVAA